MTDKEQKLIFLSNDDGYTSPGLRVLIDALRPLGNIVAVAPDAPRSGYGCAISANTPVHYRLVSEEPGVTIYACTGTPMDCIKLARHTILRREPDLVVAGINHGDNSGVNVHYSGTMGIVIEGCLNRIPSIGFSYCSHRSDIDFTPCISYISRISRMVLEDGLPVHTCLNVNFPDAPAFRGIKICRQAMGAWVNEWERCPRERDPNYFWLAGEFRPYEPDNVETDYHALKNNFVAVTPTTVDVTAVNFLRDLQSRIG
ncbi:MAG: 5'/3'-nucleotidase SurE [Prevotellaceae bacterium]|jgi:5'-nucleotidase|nr:5'/3'-nucleotidase SurE [Prevotellaceae bacterium]